jgi:heterodisulfide reductase subunit C
VSDTEGETESKNSFILSEELDPNFKFEVAKEHGGEAIKYCFQCGTCAAGCPIRTIEGSFNPRTIIRKVLLGLKKDVLSSKEIWMCSNCYICYERCPQDVRFTDIIFALRNIATREGYAHSSFIKQAELIEDMGRLYEVTELELDKRETNDLPPILPQNHDLEKIFKKTKLMEKLKVPKEEDAE